MNSVTPPPAGDETLKDALTKQSKANNQKDGPENLDSDGEKQNQNSAMGLSLRDQYLRITRNAHLDFAPEYITTKMGETNKDHLALCGLIRTTVGYFRLAEDAENDTRLLLFSPDPDELIGDWDKKGKLRIDESVETGKLRDNVYLVSARDAHVDGARFRQDMLDFEQKLKDNSLMHLGLAMEDITPYGETRPDGSEPLKVYKLTNSKVALGLFETDEGKWKMRMYSNLRGDWDETGRFVEIDEKAPDSFSGSRVFSLGKDYKKEFDSFGEVLNEAKRYWHVSSSRMQKGKSLMSEIEPPKGSVRHITELMQKKTVSFFEQKKYRAFAVTALGAALTSASALLAGPMGVLAVGGAIGGALAMKVTEDFWTGIFDKMRSKSDTDTMNSFKPMIEKEVSADYLDPSPSNEKRMWKKINPEILPKLRLLNQHEAGMNYDHGPTTKVDCETWKTQVMLSMPHRIFGSVSAPIDDQTAITHYPNGIMSLTHVDYDTRKTSTFMAYRPDFVMSENVPLQHEIKDMLKDGQIYEISYDPETRPSAIEITRNQLKTKLGKLFRDKTKPERNDMVCTLTESFDKASEKPANQNQLTEADPKPSRFLSDGKENAAEKPVKKDPVAKKVRQRDFKV